MPPPPFFFRTRKGYSLSTARVDFCFEVLSSSAWSSRHVGKRNLSGFSCQSRVCRRRNFRGRGICFAQIPRQSHHGNMLSTLRSSIQIGICEEQVVWSECRNHTFLFQVRVRSTIISLNLHRETTTEIQNPSPPEPRNSAKTPRRMMHRDQCKREQRR